jgi:hypothetical protein
MKEMANMWDYERIIKIPTAISVYDMELPSRVSRAGVWVVPFDKGT